VLINRYELPATRNKKRQMCFEWNRPKSQCYFSGSWLNTMHGCGMENALLLISRLVFYRIIQRTVLPRPFCPLSVCPTRALWQKNERNACPHFYFTWKNVYPSFPTWRMVGGPAAKFLCVNTVSDKVVRRSLAYLSVQNGSRGTFPTSWKFGGNWLTSKTPISNQYSLVAPQR